MKLIDDIIRLIERFLIHFLVVVISSIAAHADEQNPLGISFYGSFLHTEKVPNALFFFSEIKDEDSFELRKALRDHDVEIMVLSSEGGSVFEGLQMSGIINDKGLSTYIPVESPFGEGNCASACSYMFFAGNTRIADGKLGVHQFASAKPDEKAEIGEIQSNAQFVVSEIAGFLGEYDVPAFVYPKMFQSTDMYYFKRSEMREIERIQREISRNDLTKIEAFIEEFKSALQKLAEEEKKAITEAEDEIVEVIPESIIEPMPNLRELVGQWYFDEENSSKQAQCIPFIPHVFLEIEDSPVPSLITRGSLANRIVYQPTLASTATIQCRGGGEFRATIIHDDSEQFSEIKFSKNRLKVTGELQVGDNTQPAELSFTKNKQLIPQTALKIDERLNHPTSEWKLQIPQNASPTEARCLGKIDTVKLVARETMLETDGYPYVGVRKDGKGAILDVVCETMYILDDKTSSLVELNDFDFTIAVSVYNMAGKEVKKLNLTLTHPTKHQLRSLAGRWYFNAENSAQKYVMCTPLSVLVDFEYKGGPTPALTHKNSGASIITHQPDAVSLARMQCREGGEFMATLLHFSDKPQRASFIVSETEFSIVGTVHRKGSPVGLAKLSFTRNKSPQKLPAFTVDKRLKHSTSTWKMTTSAQLSVREENCLNKLNEIKFISRNTMLETDGFPYVGVRKDGLGAVILLNCGDISINEDKYKSLAQLNDYDFTISATISHNRNVGKKVNLKFTHPDKSPIRKFTGRWYLKYDPRHGCYTSHSFFFESLGSSIVAKSNNDKNIMLNEAWAEGTIDCENGGSIKLMGSPSLKNENFDFYSIAFICSLARECQTRRITFSRVKSNRAPKITKKEQIQKAQKRLNQLGCKAGIVDGLIGKRTKRALHRFNQANNKNLSTSRLHELSSINTLNTSSKRCYNPPLEGNWTLSANNCQGHNIRAKATLEHRSGNKYDFYYENNLGDVATGVLEDKKNIVRIELNWTHGYREIVNLNLSSTNRSVHGPWSNCWVTGRKN